MIGRIMRWVGPAVVYFCAATLLAQLIGVGFLAVTGRLSKDKMFRMLAIVYNVDLDSLEEQSDKKLQISDHESPAFEEIIERRALNSLDLDLREQALDKGLNELRSLQMGLVEERRRYNMLRLSFDKQLAELNRDAKESSINEVQQTLQAIQPKQAKVQILKMLDEGDMTAVVTIIKTMPLDKRKKILAEFKTDEEATKLAEILRQIRMGVPEVTLIGETRNRLEDFRPLKP